MIDILSLHKGKLREKFEIWFDYETISVKKRHFPPFEAC